LEVYERDDFPHHQVEGGKTRSAGNFSGEGGTAKPKTVPKVGKKIHPRPEGEKKEVSLLKGRGRYPGEEDSL